MKRTKDTRKFWALFNAMPHCYKNAEKENMVLSFTNGRTFSIREMSMVEFQMMLASLEGVVKNASKPQDAEYDRWRKRVMGAVGAWCRARNYPDGKKYIFETALRACKGKYKKFNDIPLNKLRSIYGEFAGKCRVSANVAAMERERLAGLYQEAMDGENYEQAEEYKRQFDILTEKN